MDVNTKESKIEKSPETEEPKKDKIVLEESSTVTTSVEEKSVPTTGAVKKRKNVGSVGSNIPKRGITKKGKKKRIEEGAPRPPLTGYVRFMNERREKLKPSYPDKSHIEMTKIIADEWNKLGEEDKTPYLKRAEAERTAYNTAMAEFYKQKRENGQQNQNPIASITTESNGNGKVLSNGVAKYSQMNGNDNDIVANKGGNKLSPVDSKPNESRGYYPEGAIPIFTDVFLEYNKTFDLELKSLRKSNIDYEQHNSVLEKHIENMKIGVEKIQNENKELAEKNRLMEKYLDKLKFKLVEAFRNCPLPGEPNGATLENIDKYMTEMQELIANNAPEASKIKEIMDEVDLYITL